MTKPKFNLGDYLRQEAPAAGPEQIELLDVSLIVPDTRNFYSLEGIDDLAANIETVGLLDPLRVRPNADGKTCTVVSGHRRREAIRRIREGGSHMFDAGVPCIVERGESSEAMRELRLIFANSATRVMTPAELGKQAERVTELLYELKEQGVEFPGRMRDHVAAACQVSATKLARLKIIREKLIPEAAGHFDKGQLSEDAAYELARLSQTDQLRTVAFLLANRSDPKNWYANTIKQYGEDLRRVGAYQCVEKHGSRPCPNTGQIMHRLWRTGYRGYCHCAYENKCCADCGEISNCAYVCEMLKPKAEKLRAEAKAAQKAQKEAQAAAEAPAVERIRNIWLRFGNALSRANMEDADLRKKTGEKLYQLSSDKVASLEAGEYAPKIKPTMILPFFNSSYLTDADRYIRAADALGCSLDYLLCRTDVPEVATKAARPAETVSDPDTAPAWKGGTPPAPGRYLCRIDMGDGGCHEQQCEYSDGGWTVYGRPIETVGFEVRSWWPLPKKDLFWEPETDDEDEEEDEASDGND